MAKVWQGKFEFPPVAHGPLPCPSVGDFEYFSFNVIRKRGAAKLIKSVKEGMATGPDILLVVFCEN